MNADTVVGAGAAGATAPQRDPRALAANLRRLRKEHGMTQEAVAQRVSLDQSAINHLESGRARPSEGTLLGLAGLYDVSIDSLYAVASGGGKGGGDGRG